MSIFTRHPNDVKMSYLQHMGYAFSVTGRLAMAAFCCFIHAFFPFLFTTTASKIVNKIYDEIQGRMVEK